MPAGIEHAHADADSAALQRAELFVRERSAVQPALHADARLVQGIRDFVGMAAFHVEREDTGETFVRFTGIQLHMRLYREKLVQVPRQRQLARRDLLYAGGAHGGYARVQAGDGRRVQGARLERSGDSSGICSCRDRLPEPPAISGAGKTWPERTMTPTPAGRTGPYAPARTECRYRPVPATAADFRRLRGVDCKNEPAFFCKRAEPANRQAPAEQVGRCGCDEHFGFGTDGAPVGVHRLVVVVYRLTRCNVAPDALLAQTVDGPQHGIVFQVAHHDMVSGPAAAEQGRY